MNMVGEAAMILFFCAAVSVLLYRFAKHKSQHKAADRLLVVTTGIGFVLGAIRAAMKEPVAWTVVLYISGALLCYTAMLFSFPDKENHGHE